MELNEIIKQITENYIKNMDLADIVYGTYIGNGIKIDNKPIPIPADMVDIPNALKDSAMPLKSGDRIAILKKQGGQRYYILDRT